MSAGNEVGSRTLSTAALTNAVLWILSIVALILVTRRCPSAKGLFVILAVGLAAATAIFVTVRKQR